MVRVQCKECGVTKFAEMDVWGRPERDLGVKGWRKEGMGGNVWCVCGERDLALG